MLLHNSRLMLVELVPGYHPVVVDLVDQLERLSFGGARNAQCTFDMLQV